jgi:pantoate kinase
MFVVFREAKAVSPGGISSFFEICDRTPYGKPISNLEKVGARGGGFGIQRGVITKVSVSETKANDIQIYINGKIAPEARTTLTVAEMLLEKVNMPFSVRIDHKVEVPIGAGFGTSAGGALTASLALSAALDLKMTYNQIGTIAHIAEVKCGTGLGTVGPLMIGGCVLSLEPGAPGTAVIDRIPLSRDYVIVAGVFGPTSTKQVLYSPAKRELINRYGRRTLETILAEPSVENFLSSCLDFAEKTGFVTARVKKLVKIADKAGAIGAAQNMLGEAVHAIALEGNAADVAEAFKQVLPKESVILSKISLQGAQLVENEEI